ncbi:hypothetical protein ACIQUM_33385 [Amycolatopsis azurea]|uniref:hypothetical protein n=1 Tax=Amycolatopsis azurea TaxID=36819 RepID=UPI0037FFE973
MLIAITLRQSSWYGNQVVATRASLARLTTNGQAIDVIVGLVRRNPVGKWHRGITSGPGPSATLTTPESGDPIKALMQAQRSAARRGPPATTVNAMPDEDRYRTLRQFHS